MYLKNHIAYRFLTDPDFTMEMIETQYPEEYKSLAKKQGFDHLDDIAKVRVAQLYELANNENQKSFLITRTVLDKLDMLKVNRGKDGNFDWSVFSHLKPLKYTFILPPMDDSTGGICIRMKIGGKTVNEGFIELIYLYFNLDKRSRDYGMANWELLYANMTENEPCEHFNHENVKGKKIDELIYKLLCFMFLSDNEEEIIQPGQKKGTQKTGKIINILPFPLTLVTSKWNITSIRTEGFQVSGHFALRWTGTGRTMPRMVLIEPYEKHGYIRHAHKPVT